MFLSYKLSFNVLEQKNIFLIAFEEIISIMGCGAITTDQKYQATKKYQKPENRRQKKKQALKGIINIDQIFQNIKKLEVHLAQVDKQSIDKILSKHYLLYKLAKEERRELINKMELYQTKMGQYVFQQGNPASMFFIIQKGKVLIQINGQNVKEMGPKDYFGQLALIYAAPRSASVKVLQNCTFWALSQSVFKKTLSQLVKRNYKIAKSYINRIPLFNFLSQKQKDLISYNMYTLKYENHQEIFKQGDDSNSFYVIVSGQVEVLIPGKDNIILKEGETFGQNSLKENQFRSGTAKSLGKSHLLSIGREDIVQCLGNNFHKLMYFNIIKWAFKRSKVFENISTTNIEKILMEAVIKKHDDGDIVLNQKSQIKEIFISLQGKINGYDQSNIIFQDLYTDKNAKSKLSLIKKGDGHIFSLSRSKLLRILGNKEEQHLNSLETEGNSLSTKKIISAVRFEELYMLKKLGEGQFGKVFLVQSRKTGQKFALKCIQKNMIIKHKMETFIIDQKQILETVNFPLIVNFQKSFKDTHYIYILMGFIDGGDFFDILRQIGLLNAKQTKFYTACMLLCIEHLHKKNIVYRDLKPENSVVDAQGYLHMIDLGTAKRLNQQMGYRTFTTIGTPHYMAPQILQGKGYSFSVDIWSLGVLVYEMVCGKLPFGDNLDDPMQIYNEMQSKELIFPDFYRDRDGKELMRRLISKNYATRNVQNFKVIKKMQYFKDVNWKGIISKTAPTPYVPKKKQIQDKVFKDIKALDFLQKQKAKTKKILKPNIPDWDSCFQ